MRQLKLIVDAQLRRNQGRWRIFFSARKFHQFDYSIN